MSTGLIDGCWKTLYAAAAGGGLVDPVGHRGEKPGTEAMLRGYENEGAGGRESNG